MNDKYNWDLKDIFETKQDFDNYCKELEKDLEEIKNYKGKLAECSENIYKCYEIYEKALEKIENIYAYGMLTYHLDMSNQESIKLFKQVENIEANFGVEISFIIPEITKIDEKVLEKWILENKKLKKYERILKDIIEDKKHILSETEESLLSSYQEVFSSSENTYDILTNAEFKYGKLKEENGNETEMTDGNYSRFLKSKNEDIRKQAFDLMYNQYSKFENTITDLYLTRVKQAVITSKLRKYKSSLEKAVLNDDASLKVYEKLIESINKNLSVNHKFIKLKKDLLKKEIHLWDMYVNPIENEDEKISFDDARKEVLNGLEILGEEYTEKLKEAFDNKWIDVFEKPNKRSGAYSMGVYGKHPFVLLNFVETKRDISTVAHELGHSMHSYYSNKTQNIINSNYTIMVAEVASTVNEILLINYQIENETNKLKKMELIYELLEMIRATLFRQAMFAEFEKIIHEKIEKSEMLSSEDLCNIYYELNKKYFGEDAVIDEKIKYEWLRIPHFYTPFYVYKYATGISSAIAIASKILKKEPGFTEKYIEMLKQGCLKKSVELLKMVDVDLESNNPYDDAIQFYNEKIDELQKLVL